MSLLRFFIKTHFGRLHLSCRWHFFGHYPRFMTIVENGTSLFLHACVEVESRTQRSRPRPRTAFPRTDTLKAKDRNDRGQGQGPRTQAQVLSKKNFHTNFSGDLKKKGLHKNFSSDLHKKTFSKKFFQRSTKFNNSKNSAVLEPRTGQFSRA